MHTHRSKALDLWRWVATFGSATIAFFPLWIWLILYKIIGPIGFWQKFVILGGGIWLFGTAQFICLVIWVAIMISAIWDA